MSTLEIIVTFFSAVAFGLGVWLVYQQSLIKQILDEIKAERAAAKAAATGDRERTERLIDLTKELITMVRAMSEDSSKEHVGMLNLIKEEGAAHRESHKDMERALTKVLAHHEAKR